MSRLYILYDARACDGDSSAANVLVVCEDNNEARSYRGEFGSMACYSYEDGKELTDEKHEWNWYDR